jgi:hypothetical protein
MSDKDAYYFKHFCNARNDRKIKKARIQLGIEAYAIFFMILEILREQQDFKYPLEDLDVLADDLGVSIQKVEVVIKNYNLFEIDNDENFFSIAQINSLQSWIELREVNRIKGLKSGIVRRKKIEDDINKLSQAHSIKQQFSNSSAADKLLYSNIDYSIKNDIKNSTINKKDYFNFVEQMREKYSGDSNRNFFPTIFEYNEQEIALDSSGKLYTKYQNKTLDTEKAFEIWEYIYNNQDKIIPIEQKSQQAEINKKEDETFINKKVKNLIQVQKNI